MLKKLLKYEFMSTVRIYVPMFIIIMALTVFGKLSLMVSSKYDIALTTSILLIFFYVISLITAAVMTFVITVMRFYKNLIGNEGYLMFTLPVKPSMHILSKLITTIVWMFATGLTIILSIFIMLIKYEHLDTIKYFVNLVYEALKENANTAFYTMLILVFINIIVSSISGILMLYASMAIGQLFRKNRVLGSIIAYIGLYTVVQIVSGIILLIYTALDYNNLSNMQNVMPNQSSNIILFMTLIISVVFMIGYYVITDYIFTKRLNLE